MRRISSLSVLCNLAVLLASTSAVAQPAAEPAPTEEPPAEAPPAPAEPPASEEPAEEAEAAPAESEPAPVDSAPRPAAPGPGTGAAPAILGSGTEEMGFPDPAADADTLTDQEKERPEADKTKEDDRIFAAEWWAHTRPALELGGYFRVRAELFHKFSLNRYNDPASSIWPRPADDFYDDSTGTYGPSLCTPDEEENGRSDSASDATQNCHNNTQAGANLRLRFAPQLVVSENVRVMSQIDLLDNLVMGSTPTSYNNSINGGGYSVDPKTGTPLGASDNTQLPPNSGTNSTRDSIAVKRAWAEYATPVGALRFGRMPSHWGLGIFQNSGDGYDDDFQSTVDRIQFIGGFKSYDLYIGGAWDLADEGPTSQSFSSAGQQPYDLAQLDDLDQYVFSIFRKRSPQLEQMDLAKDKLVINGGLYFMYQQQILAHRASGSCDAEGEAAATLDCAPGDASTGYSRSGAHVFVPDVWFQLKYGKFRFELEALTVQGTVDNLASTAGANDFENPNGDDGWRLNQWGIATEIEQKLVEDKLRLMFGFGYASGDGDVEGLGAGTDNQPAQLVDRTLSTYRFHPAHRIDLILHRHLLSRVQGTYYFRPSVDYDFLRDTRGQRIGGGVAAIWTRASHFMQSPGHERDLGIELNASLYFQSKDGVLNDDPDQMGGFFSKLEYGVLFPLGGLGYQSAEATRIADNNLSTEINSAQTLRLYLGVMF